MNSQGAENIKQIEAIRQRMLRGEVTYEQAKALAAPVIKRIDEAGKEIAKRHGRRYTPVSFAGLMR